MKDPVQGMGLIPYAAEQQQPEQIYYKQHKSSFPSNPPYPITKGYGTITPY